MTVQECVVAAARGWLGTRFHHQGRIRKTATHKGGVDCLGLLIGVAIECGLLSRLGTPLQHHDELDYPHYPDSVHLQEVLGNLLYPVDVSAVSAGDVVLMNIDSNPQHLAIATNTGIIHAYAPARAVVEHALDAWWRERIVAVYRLQS